MIEIEEISKRYGDTTVVSDVSLTVAPHTVTVVVERPAPARRRSSE